MTAEHPRPNDTRAGPDYNIEGFPFELEQAIWAREGTPLSADEIRFRCPLPDHQDVHPSARYQTTKHVWYCDVCGVGGDAHDLAERLGLDAPGCTLAQYAALKQLPVDALREWGLTQISYQSAPAVRIPYFDVNGNEVTIQFRVARHRRPKLKFKSGSKTHLYGLWRRDQAIETGQVVVVEGPSDCHALWFYGDPAIGLPSAASYNPSRDDSWFDGIPTIYIVIEPDKGGEAVERWLTASRIRERAWLIDLSPFGVKDPSALHCLDPASFQKRWAQAKAEAVLWADRERAKHEHLAAEAEREAGDLLDAPDVLALVGEAMADAGYAGDLQPPILAYLALTSRLTDRPLNLAFVARASAGKNRAVDTAVALMPPDAYYLINAASERVLIFNTEDFQHRFVIFNEADSIPEDGPAATAIRNLAADNALRYEITEQDASTGRWGTRLIEKPGPTGLITTSTRSLGDQLGTRVLETTIPDSEEQTRLIMEKQALEAMGVARPAADANRFIAYQRWLALRGERRVVIPFALALAKLIPAKGLRMRRDFPKLLSAVKAVAILHQRRRDRMQDGEIVANLQDYAAARALLAPVFDAITTQGLTPAIQQTVEAIGEDELEVTIGTLVERLGLEKPSVWYRVRKACAGGWLVNTETRKAQPAKLRRGDPLPERSITLPLPEDLAAEVVERMSVSTETEKEGPPPPTRSVSADREEDSDHDEERSRLLEEDGMADTGGGGSSLPESVETLIHDRLDTANGHKPHEPLEGRALVTERDDSTPWAEEGVADPPAPSPALGLTGTATSRIAFAESKVLLITQADALQAALSTLNGVAIAGIDCETTGLDPRHDRLRLVTCALHGRTLVTDVAAVPGWERALAPLLASPAITKVFHHAQFDVAFLAQAGLDVENVFDTMLASQLVDGGQHLRTRVADPSGRLRRGSKPAMVGYHSLAALAHRELGIVLDKSHQAADWTAPLTPDLVSYAAADAAVLMPLHEALRARLAQFGLEEIAALEFTVLPALVWLEHTGVPVDVAAWSALRDRASAEQDCLAQQIIAHLPGVNVNSPRQLVPALERLGVSVPNTQEATLRRAIDAYPVIGLLLAHKEASKRVSTYGERYLANVHPQTGRIHADYHQIGAETGRMACARPNLQNIPRDPAYRACIRPGPGRVLVKADLALIELCAAAELAGDSRMLEAIANEDDLHRLTAAAIFNKPAEAVTKDERAFGKTVNFGTLYGQGLRGLIEAAHKHGLALSDVEARSVQQRFAAAWPDLTTWRERQMRDTSRVLRTPSGRMRRLDADAPGTVRVNTPIQGLAADGFKAALAELWATRDRCPSAAPILAVHDELVVECDAEDVEHAATWVAACLHAGMTRYLTRVPVRVEVTVARDWSGTPVLDDMAIAQSNEPAASASNVRDVA